MMDYSRNWALNQEKINSGKVTIIGCEALTNYIGFYMAGLGLRNIRVIDDNISYDEKNEFLLRKSGYKVEVLEDKLLSINDDLNIEAVPLILDEFLIGNPDVLLDLTNNPYSKEKSLEYFYKNEKIKLYISASTSTTKAKAIFKKERSKISKLVKTDFLQEYSDKKQGSFTSGFLSAVILDEIRKIVSPLDGDFQYIGKLNYGLGLKNRFFEENQMFGINRNQKVLICGAGGIGTYVALNLALENVVIDIYDGDKIESHNIARQLFYHDSVGKYKVDVLQDQLKNITNAKINVRGRYITEKNLRDLGRYDAIICCADNWEARKILNSYAIYTNMRLINGSVTPFGANSEAYLPGKNRCLDCVYDLNKLIGLKPQSCAEIQESNVIMNNALIGAFIAGEVLDIQNTVLDKRFEYKSKKGEKRKFGLIENKIRRDGKCKCAN
jgi:molybdopterin/thiamine biosynthesis adenylyltransferase